MKDIRDIVYTNVGQCLQGCLLDFASVASFNATAAFDRTSASVVFGTSSCSRQPSHLISQVRVKLVKLAAMR